METQTLGIDMGASYTKIACRQPFPARGPGHFVSTENEVVMIEGMVAVPSVVIETRDKKRPWVAGRQAATLKPGTQMRVFENWKSTLYSSSSTESTADTERAASYFFEWLRDGLRRAGISLEDRCRVRISMPALSRVEKRKSRLIRCMRESGWPDDIELVVEPKANLVGVLSGGRNVVSAAGRISYGPTFGNSDKRGEPRLDYVYGEMRRYALGSRRSSKMRLSVVDFGSFTLDLANLTLNLRVTDVEAFPVEEIDAKSWEVGVLEDLDRVCLDELFAWHGIDPRELSFEVKESAKVALYSGERYAIPLSRGRVTLGSSKRDQESVSSALDAYCESAWSKMSGMLEVAEAVILTGGGVCITRVRDFFRKRLAQYDVSNVAVLSAQTAPGASTSTDFALCDWRPTGEGLGRLGTALGGASIGLGFEPDDARRQYMPRGVPL